ncbi:hypothetical protein AAFF_G00412850 [Aldrovandia affinis]|uniref:Cadherin domain-containing protein n=1 Tax=Aldrovandia affinis TaxID=143900 RepID=A0AAD7SBG0_9TELE|nr:hypothetical protein AAFF_G00412850 [Aldrovandia affinis]
MALLLLRKGRSAGVPVLQDLVGGPPGLVPRTPAVWPDQHQQEAGSRGPAQRPAGAPVPVRQLPVYSSAQVNVSIADVNDNAPQFPRDADAVTVSQGTATGTVLFIARAHDRDSGANGRVRYSLRGADEFAGTFAVEPRLGALSLNRSLPRDGPQSYTLLIRAQDGGEPTLASTLTLRVEIGEGVARDSRVIQVRAHHGRRGGAYAGLRYSLRPLSGVPPFGVHADSGWLFLSQSLDHEAVSQYRFGVLATARDGPATELSAMATVVVVVLDENDNAPVFTRDVYFFTVPEGPAPQGLIGSVKATDRDSGKNSQLSYILLSDGKRFRINSNTGEIINWVALDREQYTHHTLKVLVTDHGSPCLNATTTVHILVTDINDNPPQFLHVPAGKELNVQVWAGLPAGSVVTTMFAKDLDAGENGTVVHSLMSGDGLGHFEIDSQSGEIRTTGLFPQQPRAHYSLTVIARDNGTAPLEETAVVHLQVYHSEGLSGDASSPVFRHFSVREDCQPGTVIGSAGLPEGRSSSGASYSIAEGDGSLHFGIERSSGDLYVSQALDHEARARYLLRVRVEDGGGRLNRSVTVSVTVEDANDHSPWFADDVIVFGVEENRPEGPPVYAFKARDGTGPGGTAACATPSPTPPPSPGTTGGRCHRELTPSIAFTVTATDRAPEPSDRRHATLTAHVFLLDLNDNAPAFASSDESRVAEDAEPGSLVHRLVARDDDLGKTVSHREQEVHCACLLYLAGCLDYESAPAHTVTVQAADNGLPRLSSTQTLTVSVLDVNDQAPVFEQRVYNATVMENRGPGEPVIRVSAFDSDSEENAAVRYSLLPGPGFELFSIDPRSGEISTTTQLDRETQHKFTLRVVGRDSGVQPLSSTATVLCSVLDENDNAPEFMQPSFLIRVPENFPPGPCTRPRLLIPTPEPTAPSATAYRVGEGIDGFFAINATSGAISTVKRLDREQRSNYSLIIEAHDQGPAPRSSTARLHVLVLDENDNSPAFDQKSYRASVREGLPAGSEVVRLTATDGDEGPNGEVTFSLADEASGAFTVDASSGLVRTTRPLDREARSRYSFWATATDGCSRGPRSSAASVTVRVEDVNDNVLACAQSPVSAPVSAETALNHTVATVRALDGDEGENGTVAFRLSEPDDAVFEVGLVTGEVRLRTPLPADFFGTRLLRVEVTDGGTPALSSTCLVLIHLRGDEEEKLRFTEQVYEAAVPENSKTGSWVANVVAHDRTPDGRRIEYSVFSGNEDGAFAIHAHNGDISVKDQSRLDFEERRSVHLVVLAESGLQTAHCRVTIALLDVNDNAPTFEQQQYKSAVWEGQIHNTYVMQVFATDADSGVNGQVDYSILSGNNNGAFVMDSTRGILATNTVLDREIVASYKLVLQVVDRGSPPLTGTATVRIQVVDVNDNSPSIPPMEHVLIAENLPAGYVVTQVTANDVDLGLAVTYSLAEQGSGGGRFAIDPYTGIITLTQSLDREEASLYTLRVQASDSVHQTAADVTVEVLDVNDNPPVFSKEAYQVVVPELSAVDTLVLALSATDRDSGPNGRVSYRLLTSPSKGFYINAENGSVFTNKPLTYVTNGNAIQLLVEARDGGNPPLTAMTFVEVHVRDANDHAPRFQQPAYRVSVSEDAPLGTTLLFLRADDGDWSPENTHLDYAITGGNEEQRFCLEVGAVQSEARQRGVARLVLCAELDRESGEPPADRDRLRPGLEYHAQVSESSPGGTWLATLSAHDPDKGQNAKVRYDIVSGNGKGLFSLDALTGVVEVNRSLDYEEDPKFTLTVQASNGDGPRSRNVAFAVLYVSVLDENDNSPYFAFPTLNCSVTENLPAFSPVCAVHALDRDAGPYGQLTYSLLSPCSLDYGSGSPDRKEAFSVDPLTGDIHTRQAFDYELEREYCFLVEARDRGDQTATVRVQIAIEGADEFSPVFTRQRYLFHLPEGAKAGQSIGQVVATDHDDGQDGVLEYALAGPHPSPFFSVNKTSGAIYLSAAVYRRQGGGMGGGDLVELLVTASSPKLDSRSASCLVIVNISSAAQRREAAVKRAVPRSASSLSRGLDALDGTVGHGAPNGAGLQDFKGLVDIRVKRELANPYRHSDSSGRGSAEGEMAEDEEIKMINERPCLKCAGYTLSERACRIPDSGVPRDSDPLSYREEGGGEEMLSQLLSVRGGVGGAGGYASRYDHQMAAVGSGSLTSLMCAEEELRGSYSWDYLLDWEPRFQPLASVYSDLGQLPDEEEERAQRPLRPPPLITSTAQPGIRAVPPRMPALSRRPSFPKYSYSPLARSAGLTPSTMTPSFSPALSCST